MGPSTSVSTLLAASPSPALCLTHWTEWAHSVLCPLLPLHSCGAVHHVQRLWQCRWCQQQLGPGRRQQLLLQQQPWPWRWLQFWQWQRHQWWPQLLWWQLFHHQVHHHLLQQEELPALKSLPPELVCSPDALAEPCAQVLSLLPSYLCSLARVEKLSPSAPFSPLPRVPNTLFSLSSSDLTSRVTHIWCCKL